MREDCIDPFIQFSITGCEPPPLWWTCNTQLTVLWLPSTHILLFKYCPKRKQWKILHLVESLPSSIIKIMSPSKCLTFLTVVCDIPHSFTALHTLSCTQGFGEVVVVNASGINKVTLTPYLSLVPVCCGIVNLRGPKAHCTRPVRKRKNILVWCQLSDIHTYRFMDGRMLW